MSTKLLNRLLSINSTALEKAGLSGLKMTVMTAIPYSNSRHQLSPLVAAKGCRGYPLPHTLLARSSVLHRYLLLLLGRYAAMSQAGRAAQSYNAEAAIFADDYSGFIAQ